MSTTTVATDIIKVAPITDVSVLHLITSADLLSKFVMLILISASIYSWAIIITKYFRYRDVRTKMSAFENIFWSGQVLDTLHERVKRSTDNPLAAVFVAAMNECKRRDNVKTSSAEFALKVGLKERIMQSMNLVRNRELESLEQHLGFLSIVGSASTFIGLFGTVWGIMHSFQSIASSKNTSLAVVAPGIAEALLATAIGLCAAIPAMIFYNVLAEQANKFSNKLDDFIGELYTLLGRAIDEEKI
jgi:biopolymer transport protein TolQ